MNRRDRELAAQAKFDAVMAVRRERADRNQHMKDLREREWTYEAIGKIYGISRQRVFQITHDPESHLVKPVMPQPVPRDYNKHNGQIPHGTPTGYTYGCRGEDCPATPSCRDRRREYMRQWYQKRKERRAFDPF